MALADASCASASRMSGRCAIRSEGSPGVTGGMRKPRHAAAANAHGFRRAADQHRERGDVLPQDLLQRRDRGALGVDEAFLLRGVERGGGADVETLLDQVVDARGGGQVVARDAKAILRLEHQEIGVGHADDGGERHDLAIEPAGDGKLFGRAQRRAVLAPEVDLVAGAERGAVGRRVRTAAAAPATTPVELTRCRRRSARTRERVALALRSTIGSSAAPTTRELASAWTMRATAAATSKLEVSASSIRSVSSLEPKPRHQTTEGSAASAWRGPAR